VGAGEKASITTERRIQADMFPKTRKGENIRRRLFYLQGCKRNPWNYKMHWQDVSRPSFSPFLSLSVKRLEGKSGRLMGEGVRKLEKKGCWLAPSSWLLGENPPPPPWGGGDLP